MRLFLTIIISSLSLNTFGQPPGYVSTDGLVAWFPFNGNFNDASGNDNNGQNNDASFGTDRFGTVNSAGSFNGVSSYINGSLAGLNNPSETTLSIWLLSQGDAGGQPYDLFFQLGNYGQHTFAYSYNHSGTNIDFHSNCFYNPYSSLNINDEWHHLVIVSGVGTASFYLDGELFINMNSTNWGGGCYLGSNAFYIGGGADNQYTTGLIDEVGFWDRALTEAEIEALYTVEIPISGCTDETACNFDQDATVEDGSCIPSGCMDAGACNFNSEAECEGEACDYTCCPGPGCCGVGMNWNSDTGVCEITNPTDTNLDGCTDLNDLMDLLGSYGICVEPDCGDFVSHEGYDYSTVEIGDQCWFSENCRYLPVVSPSSEGGNTDPYYYVYGYEGTDVSAAQATANYDTYGVLYNWPAVMTEGICPSGWHIPSDEEWQMMEISLGMSNADAASEGWRGSPVGDSMKSISGWNGDGNGSNSSGFNALPGDYLYSGGFGDDNSFDGNWWSASETGSYPWRRKLSYNFDSVFRDRNSRGNGFSARCVRD